MSTTATVAFEDSLTGEVRSIYVHWDGYISGAGNTLVTYYKDESKIKKLISLGNLSVLDRIPESDPDGWDYLKQMKDGYCLSYASRGDQDTEAAYYENLTEYLDSAYPQEYNYLWKDDEWFLVDFQGEQKLRPLDWIST